MFAPPIAWSLVAIVLDKPKPQRFFIVFRRGLMTFLEKMSKYYRLAVNSQGFKPYVKQILQKIEGNGGNHKFFDWNLFYALEKGATPGNKNLEQFKRGDVHNRNTIILDDYPEVWGPDLIRNAGLALT
jgi:TFIIF-interacting CTD phosphatase-like protein